MARARVSEPAIFSQINVTPFIDVMLVLIVMMLLSLPLATHKVAVELPNGNPPPDIVIKPHQLTIDRAGALFFDGRPVSDAALPATLGAMQAQPGAVLQMNPDPEARYERFESVLATVKRAGVTRLGFTGHLPLED
ncbi:biopolymer transporter ExbD [Sphingomonas sp.]|jgi:biopolymer transport protein ExbD|uniref:ExbD/TolR family protein n=1 Tax=Sphingomonas sp. TaxID=28214 RepID=UPI002EDB511F